MRELIAEWYALLSTLNAAVAEPLRTLADSLGLPVASPLLFGLIGATAPCQLTTNASAMARSALAYLLGKALVYTLLGIAVMLAGRQLAQSSIPVAVVARKVLGPVMLLLGLHLLGWVPLRFSLGQGPAAWLEARVGAGTLGAFLLGIAFSLAFCPTLFLLFFGLTLPLALSSPVGVVYPGLFALGTALPLLGLAGLLTAGIGVTQCQAPRARRLAAWLQPVAGGVLVLAGLNDTVTYWFL
jgi:cytochrome c biogenesis protein CcdA